MSAAIVWARHLVTNERIDVELRPRRVFRRELVFHSSVFGGIDSPSVLVYMSVVKDIERVGDYAKNLLDLARDGADLSKTPDAAMTRAGNGICGGRVGICGFGTRLGIWRASSVVGVRWRTPSATASRCERTR